MMSGTKIAAWWITISTAIDMIGFVIALPSHIGDPTWSAHAQFHLVMSVIWLAGLTVMLMALVWGPLQEGKRWSFWASLAGFLAAQGGYFLAIVLVWAGRPYETWYDIALAINLLLGAIGFWLMRREIWHQPLPPK